MQVVVLARACFLYRLPTCSDLFTDVSASENSMMITLILYLPLLTFSQFLYSHACTRCSRLLRALIQRQWRRLISVSFYARARIEIKLTRLQFSDSSLALANPILVFSFFFFPFFVSRNAGNTGTDVWCWNLLFADQGEYLSL